MIKLDEAQIALEQAQTFWQQQEWQLTIEACAKALGLDQNLAQAHKLMGDALQKTGKSKEAIGYYQQAIALQPDFAKVYVNLGSLYANQKQWDQAIDYYQQALKIDPGLLVVHQHLAKILHKQQQRSLVASTTTVEDYKRRIQVLKQQGQWELALEQYQQLTQLVANPVEIYREMASLCEKLGRWKDAAQYCRLMLQLSGLGSNRPVLAIKPASSLSPQQKKTTSGEEYLKSAENLIQAGNYQAAMTCYRQAIEQQPDLVYAYLGWAKLLTRAGAIKQAIACYLEGLKQIPDHPELYLRLGHLYQMDSKWSQAAVCYQKAIQYAPESWEAYHELGEVLSKQEQWSEAIVAYRQAINYNPDFSWSYNNLGYALIQVGQWQDALPIYQQAIDLNPDFPWAYYNLGEAYSMLDRWSEALSYYEQAARIKEDLPKIQQKIGYALYKRSEADRNQALERFYLAINQDPKNPQVYHQALAIDKTNVELYLRLGQLLEEQGQLEEAIVTYQMALQVQPKNAVVMTRLQEVLQKKTAIAP